MVGQHTIPLLSGYPHRHRHEQGALRRRRRRGEHAGRRRADLLSCASHLNAGSSSGDMCRTCVEHTRLTTHVTKSGCAVFVKLAR